MKRRADGIKRVEELGANRWDRSSNNGRGKRAEDRARWFLKRPARAVSHSAGPSWLLAMPVLCRVYSAMHGELNFPCLQCLQRGRRFALFITREQSSQQHIVPTYDLFFGQKKIHFRNNADVKGRVGGKTSFSRGTNSLFRSSRTETQLAVQTLSFQHFFFFVRSLPHFLNRIIYRALLLFWLSFLVGNASAGLKE